MVVVFVFQKGDISVLFREEHFYFALAKLYFASVDI